MLTTDQVSFSYSLYSHPNAVSFIKESFHIIIQASIHIQKKKKLKHGTLWILFSFVLPSPAEAIKSPLGENRTALTGEECRFNSERKSILTGKESTNCLLCFFST